MSLNKMLLRLQCHLQSCQRKFLAYFCFYLHLLSFSPLRLRIYRLTNFRAKFKTTCKNRLFFEFRAKIREPENSESQRADHNFLFVHRRFSLSLHLSLHPCIIPNAGFYALLLPLRKYCYCIFSGLLLLVLLLLLKSTMKLMLLLLILLRNSLKYCYCY